MNKHYTKFEYKGMKTLELQITQTKHPKLLRTDGQTVDGRSGPSARPAFANATMEKMAQ